MNLSDNLTSIGSRAFKSSKIEEIKLPKNVISVGDSSFETASLRSFDVAEGSRLKYINESAFAGSSLVSFSMPNTVEGLGDHAFFRCSSLRRVNISSSLRTIGYESFCDTALESVVLPDSIRKIGFY